MAVLIPSFPLSLFLVLSGTVMDAYSKITIGFRNKISQRRPNNDNVAKILGTTDVSNQAMGCALRLCVMEHFEMDDGYIALPQARILLSHTGRSGKQGAVRGDVVTHIDGESVAGKDANQLLVLLHRKKGQGKVMMTLNAEHSVAEALKRRAAAIVNM